MDQNRPQPTPEDVQALDLQALWQQGFVVWERDPQAAGVPVLREAVLALAAEANAPVMYAKPALVLSPHAMVTPTGLVLLNLLQARPDLVPLVLPKDLQRAVTRELGPGAKVEVCGAVVSDRTRPFFPWHTHIDGVDEGERARKRQWPTIEKQRRILSLFYLNDVGEDGGPLMVVPRRRGDPTEPVAPLQQAEWPGQLALHPKAGSIVVLDECTWHAVQPMQREGLRVLVGFYFIAADTVASPSAELPLRLVEP